MLLKTKPSTARCNQEIYISYLLSDPQYTSCTRLAKIMETISHDSINRFLERERFEPRDLFEEEKNKIVFDGGILSVDDSVLDKPYSDPEKASLIDLFWSGKHKCVVKGINLVSLLKPSWVTGDSWYSSLENLKFIRAKKLNFMFGVENNRIVSVLRGQYIQIQKFEGWSAQDMETMYSKEYGLIKACRQLYKNAHRYYVMSMADLNNLESVTMTDFKKVHDAHWTIEQFHRALKQVCNVERFQVRNENPIKNHIKISHWYELKRDLYIKVIRDYITLAAKNQSVVNA
jgi:hypothetical protein